MQRQSPKNLMKKSLTVKVRTVTTNEKQKRLAEHERYSIVGGYFRVCMTVVVTVLVIPVPRVIPIATLSYREWCLS